MFNLDQTDGVTLTDREQAMTTYTPLSDTDRVAVAEAIIGYAGGPRTRHDGAGQAYYTPGTDVIHLPKLTGRRDGLNLPDERGRHPAEDN